MVSDHRTLGDVVSAPVVESEASTEDAPKNGPPTGWRGLIFPVNTESGDGRIYELADGAEPDVRPLPLPLCAQSEISEGHKGGVGVGLLERVWMGEGGVWAEGPFDLADPVAVEWARKLGAGFAGWVSADLDRTQYKVIPLDESGAEIEPEQLAEIEVADQKYVISSWRLMGATMVSGPAFAEAKIEPVWDYTSAADVHRLVAAATKGVEKETTPETDNESPQLDTGNNKIPAKVAEEEHTGGMVALIPTDADAQRLAVEGGEPIEELHTTLAYLGKDVRGWTPEQQAAVIEAIEQVRPAPVEGKVFAHARFNPGPDGPEECAVYLTEAQGLTDLRNAVVAALKGHPGVPVDDETDTYDSFVPHVTAGYGLDVGQLAETGPIRYDRLRVALAGKHHDVPLDPTTANLVAAAIVYPAADFDDPDLPMPTPITVTEGGRVFGHIACWGTCHIGFADVCVTPPETSHDYRYFHQGLVDTSTGELAVGKLTLGTGHAGLNKSAAAAAAHYDHTGAAVAVVRAGEDDHGIWFSGKLLPGTTDEDIATLKRSGLSGDWRGINGNLELVAALAVNVPGFPIPRTEALSASGTQSLIAAGVMPNHTAQRQVKKPGTIDPAKLDEVFAEAGAQAQAAFIRAHAATARVNQVRADTVSRRVARYRRKRRERRLSTVTASIAPIRLAALARRVDAAVDTPGGRMPPQLKKYWLSGPGLARWATTPTPYRALVKALSEEIQDMTPEQIKGLAANLYHAHFGTWPGKQGKDD